MPGLRKGRAMALRKLQIAKEKSDAKKNEREEIEVRILGLLGRLGGINHEVIKEQNENERKEEKVEFLDILIEKMTGFHIGVNMLDFGIQVKLNSILARIIHVAELTSDHENKIEA